MFRINWKSYWYNLYSNCNAQGEPLALCGGDKLRKKDFINDTQVSLDIPDKKILEKKMSDIIARGWLSEGIYTKKYLGHVKTGYPIKYFLYQMAH